VKCRNFNNLKYFVYFKLIQISKNYFTNHRQKTSDLFFLSLKSYKGFHAESQLEKRQNTTQQVQLILNQQHIGLHDPEIIKCEHRGQAQNYELLDCLLCLRFISPFPNMQFHKLNYKECHHSCEFWAIRRCRVHEFIY